jgi:hypothetical protein
VILEHDAVDHHHGEPEVAQIWPRSLAASRRLELLLDLLSAVHRARSVNPGVGITVVATELYEPEDVDRARVRLAALGADPAPEPTA